MLEVLTPEEAAKILKVSPRTVVDLCAAGRIPRAAKIGRRWRIPADGLADLFPPVPSPPMLPAKSSDSHREERRDDKLARLLRRGW